MKLFTIALLCMAPAISTLFTAAQSFDTDELFELAQRSSDAAESNAALLAHARRTLNHVRDLSELHATLVRRVNEFTSPSTALEIKIAKAERELKALQKKRAKLAKEKIDPVSRPDVKEALLKEDDKNIKAKQGELNTLRSQRKK